MSVVLSQLFLLESTGHNICVRGLQLAKAVFFTFKINYYIPVSEPVERLLITFCLPGWFDLQFYSCVSEFRGF